MQNISWSVSRDVEKEIWVVWGQSLKKINLANRCKEVKTKGEKQEVY